MKRFLILALTVLVQFSTARAEQNVTINNNAPPAAATTCQQSTTNYVFGHPTTTTCDRYVTTPVVPQVMIQQNNGGLPQYNPHNGLALNPDNPLVTIVQPAPAKKKPHKKRRYEKEDSAESQINSN